MEDGTRLRSAGVLSAEMPDTAPPGLLRALPDGWVMLGRCRVGAAGPASYPTGCFALAHPTTGIALLDVAPDVTPNAEARLRRTLGAAGFWTSFPGSLPIWHGRIDLSSWRSLPGIVAEGFSELPPLTLAGKEGWIAAARLALAADPAWELPGAAPVQPALPDFEGDVGPAPGAARLRSRWRRLWLPAGFALAFVLGAASGALLLLGNSAPPPGRSSRADDIAVPAAMQAGPEPAVAAPTSRGGSAAASAQVEPAMGMPAAGTVGEGPPGAADAALPPPPAAPRPPVRKAAQPAVKIDRACSQALYRFQQGESLSAAEQAYLHEGCATHR